MVMSAFDEATHASAPISPNDRPRRESGTKAG
jgi:hypothetical protein